MRVYVIHPGANFATSDVYDGLVAGLCACGVEVHEGRIDTILSFYDTAVRAGVATGAMDPTKFTPGLFNKQRLASAHITQSILDVWPDLVICVSGHNYHTQDVRALRKVGLKTAVLLTEAPYFGDVEAQIGQYYDVRFTNERRSAARLDAHYLPHAYNPAIHTPDGPRAPVCDAFFVGSWFEERMRLLDGLRASGTDLVWRGHDLSDTPADILLNTDAAAYYRSARISLNMHRTTTSHGEGQHIGAGEAESLNPRAYEICACGGFMLCDDSRAELWDVYGERAATYRAGDADDLAARMRYWFAHPDRREETARAMHAAVQPHSWTARAKQVLEVFP